MMYGKIVIVLNASVLESYRQHPTLSQCRRLLHTGRKGLRSKGHGRVETRRYWITDKIDWLEIKADWKKLTTIGLVESEIYKNDKVTIERRCFINSINPDAKRFASAVRQHWAIENNLHWQLDVSFDEDSLRMRVGYAAQNLSIVRRMVLNILKQDTLTQASIKAKRKKAGWNKDYLKQLLAKLFNF